jgi:cobalt-zinc-cadmium efflux system outer membrane protein
MNRICAAFVPLAVSLFAGCAVNSTGAFRGVEDTVAGASGKRVKWMRTGAEEAEARSSVRALLSKPLTADAAAQVALLNSRSLQARFEEIGISYADYVQAGLPRNPRIGGHIDYSIVGRSYEYEALGEVMNLLLIPLNRRVARSGLERTKMRIASEVLGLVAETKTAFYNLQAREQLLARLKLIATANEASADLAKGLHDAGNITDLDLANQAATFNQSRIDVAQTQAQLRSDRERLNRLMGLWGADTSWTARSELPPIPKQEIAMKKLESIAVRQRLDLAMARQNVDAIGLALSLKSKTRFAPVSIDVGIHGEKEDDGAKRRGPTVDLEIPLFDQGQGAIAKLQSQYRQAVRELEAAAIDARSEVREARDLVLANRDQAKFYREVLLPQRLRIVNETQLQFNAMQIGGFQLLQAKERELQTERAYIEAWRDYWIARTELERALYGGTGGGSPMTAREAGTRGISNGSGESRDH